MQPIVVLYVSCIKSTLFTLRGNVIIIIKLRKEKCLAISLISQYILYKANDYLKNYFQMVPFTSNYWLRKMCIHMYSVLDK